jgi:cytochrome c553
MNKIRLIRSALVLTLIFTSSSLWAAGDAQSGKSKAVTCMGCHSIEGYSNAYPNYRVPRIGGQHSAYIIAALKAYKTGQRNHPTMTAQADGLSDQDMEDIAAYIGEMAQ